MQWKYDIMDSKEKGNKTLSLLVREKEASISVDFTVKTLLCAGYTGRDQDKVREHIEELKKIGVPAPKKVPAVYRVAAYLLTNEEEIEVKGEETSGEVEYVVLLKGGRIYVTVGSDHTDRWLETISIDRAKQTCPKVIAKEAWVYDEVQNHWDEVKMRAYATKSNKRLLYQEDTLEALLSVNDLIKTFKIEEDTVIFSGTIPSSVELLYADEFEIELYDPKLNRAIRHKYKVKVI